MQTRLCRLYGKQDIRIETDRVALPGAGEVVVAIGAGGICGSDLHYFQDGGFGPIRVREPIVLGHEVAGTVLSVGKDAGNIKEGDRVALNPSRACGSCKYCETGLFQHCLHMRFFGSALRFPHEQGAFRDKMVVRAAQCEKISAGTTLAEAACAEPLAVCLHARSRAGQLRGKRVLITGAGPIGVLCAALAGEAGAAEVVVTDLQNIPLTVASEMGATRTINVLEQAEAMDPYFADKGYFDVVFECSAAAPAIRTAVEAVRPLGTIVQVGVAGDTLVPVNLLVGKEINLCGTHRFHAEFAEAVTLIDNRVVDVRPMITGTYPLEQVQSAFEIAGDRTQAVKVQLSFAGAG
jgi:L-idonate 5-dehydrogenase